MILENFLRGRRRHVWISVGNDLALDARRDLDDLGCGVPSDEEGDESDEEESGEESGSLERKGKRKVWMRACVSLRGRGGWGRGGREVFGVGSNLIDLSPLLCKKKTGQGKGNKARKRYAPDKASNSEKEKATGEGVHIPSYQQNKLGYSRIREGDGVMFITYSSLVASTMKGNKSRLKQLLQWCGGESFDGCVLLDECHRAKNLYAAGGGASTKAGAAVVELQKQLPNARVVYCSATGASEPRNLGYMVRLGLWGAPSSPFTNFQHFLSAVEGRCVALLLMIILQGIGAMELVAMHLKQTGVMVCRTLSFSGCSFEV
ncbi:unnamed protein product, partial [Choristocarpus tenellus]